MLSLTSCSCAEPVFPHEVELVKQFSSREQHRRAAASMHSDGLDFCLRAFKISSRGEKKKKKLCHTLFPPLEKGKKKNLLQTSSRCRKWHKVWQGSLSAAFLMLFFLLSQIISLHSFGPFFKTIWVFLELLSFRMRNVKYRCWNKGTLWCKSLASSEFMSKHKKGG